MNNKMPIAVYGLSLETEKHLPKLLEEYEVVGLLDGFRTDGQMYGCSIISLETAIEQGIEKIIVVARPGSCKAIVRKIGDICKCNDVELWDIRGNNLLEKKVVRYNFDHVDDYIKEDVIAKIQQVDVVSFDLFDTLVMRNTLYSSDVIDILAIRLREREIEIVDFVEKRIAAEKKLSQNYAPTLEALYEEVLGEDNAEINGLAKELSRLEFETDLSLLTPRKEVVELLNLANKFGKKVYITTDTYYSKKQILMLLERNKISDYEDVLVSSAYGISKSQGLFDELIRVAETSKILHIGDDQICDIESAEKSGLCVQKIYSGAELLDFVGGLGLYESIDGLSDRIRVGIVVASVFNSPFQFEEEHSLIKVTNSFDVGYLFFSPIILDFVLWFKQQQEKYECTNLWFAARDGYLIQKIFCLLYPQENSTYFLTSRIAAIRAGVENEEDICYVDEMKFSGELEQNLKLRFGIDVKDVVCDVDATKDGLLKYSKSILSSSLRKRENNKKYIDKLNVHSGNVAFFDFVAKGTSQMYIQRLVKNLIIGFYFLQLEPGCLTDKNIRIIPFYSEAERESCSIFEDYYILETILTSLEPSVTEFSEDGSPLYAEESRSRDDINCIETVHAGILAYVKKYMSICPKSEIKINKKFDELCLSLIHKFDIQDKDFLKIVVEDPFFNRRTNVTDVI